MKEQVYYHAGHDEIWLVENDEWIYRGCQQCIETSFGGQTIKVPDHLALFRWKISHREDWNRALKIGILIHLGEL